MAEKRKRRSKRIAQSGASPQQQNLPPSKLDFKTPPKPVQPTTAVQQQETALQQPSDDDTTTTTTTTTATKAQQLIDSQRKSVAMLTAVKQAIDRLPAQEMESSLAEKGFWYGDNILDSLEILQELESEGNRMLEFMTQDLNRLGSGEFIVEVKGGEDQYQQCPRIIEWVVSTTKHLPERFKNDSSSSVLLDASRTMATLRTFDFKTLQASRQLLMTEGAAELPERPFGTTVTDPETDLRRISLCYYLVPPDWSEDCGGGLSFCSSKKDMEDITSVAAKRDRLVVWKSCDQLVRQDAFTGMMDGGRSTVASCIELHLVAATTAS